MAHSPGSVQREARAILDAKTKPQGSLGQLEDWALKLAVRQGTTTPTAAEARALVFAGDHGVAFAHSVSAFPSSVTVPVFQSIAAGLAACVVLARSCGASLELVDVGVNLPAGPVPLPQCDNRVRVTHRRVCNGTRDMTAQAALSGEEVREAMAAGAAALRSAECAGCTVVCVGEIGIGNTTAAAALLSALAGAPAEETTGRGSGIDDDAWANKCDLVTRAVRRARRAIGDAAAPSAPDATLVDAPSRGDSDWQKPPENTACEEVRQCDAGEAAALMAEVGGLELAAIAGAICEAAEPESKAVVLVDGFIAGVAALAAVCMVPAAAECVLLSHASAERGARVLLDALRARGVAAPPLDMGMRLGEATGALLCVPIVRAAAAMLREMGSLQQTLELAGPGT